EQAAVLLHSARRVFVVGIGTSLHAAMIGAWLLRAAGADARAVSSFDFALYPDSFPVSAEDAVVVMAHTGVKTYSAVSMQRPNEAPACGLVIKAREAAYVPVDALAAEQFLHGPMVAMNEGDLLAAVAVPGNAYDRVAAICAVANGMGARLWIVGSSVAATPQA